MRNHNKGNPYHYFRTFPHANSLRKQADRFEDDRREILEYSCCQIRLRNGKSKIPDLYDDVYPDGTGKWITKPRSNDFSRRTIRKLEERRDKMFLHLEFSNGSNPYVFYGTIDQVNEDLDLWKRFWNVRIIKTLDDGSMFGVAEEKESAN